jgi:uncharacterized protein with HEPN domain
MNPDLDLLNVIRRAAQAIAEHVGDYDRITFEADRKSLSAVLYEIVVVGEGVKRLSAEFRLAHPQVPWKRVTGMRDRVVHSFDEVDSDLVWIVINVHAPGLITAVDDIKAQESKT